MTSGSLRRIRPGDRFFRGPRMTFSLAATDPTALGEKFFRRTRSKNLTSGTVGTVWDMPDGMSRRPQIFLMLPKRALLRSAVPQPLRGF